LIYLGDIALPTINPDHLAAVLAIINQAPFFQHLSMRVLELGPGRATVAMDIGQKHMNPFGGLHGGAYTSGIDTAAYWSAYCDLPGDVGMISIDLKVDFLAPVLGGRIIISGQSIKSGKTLFLTEARIHDGQGKLLAHGTSKLMVTKGMQAVADLGGRGSLPPKFLPSQA
jgi:uncharacterized protein (TIGR00369 family)